jgi:hypothetical protein
MGSCGARRQITSRPLLSVVLEKEKLLNGVVAVITYHVPGGCTLKVFWGHNRTLAQLLVMGELAPQSHPGFSDGRGALIVNLKRYN